MVKIPDEKTRLCTILERTGPKSYQGCILINFGKSQIFSKELIHNGDRLFVGDTRYSGTIEQLDKMYSNGIPKSVIDIVNSDSYPLEGIPVSKMNLPIGKKQELELLLNNITPYVEELPKGRGFRIVQGKELGYESKCIPKNFLEIKKDGCYFVDNKLLTSINPKAPFAPFAIFYQVSKVN
ncbi:MAG: hypothetical protein HRU03_06470 [Nanoarchaeales archaeon]|nr:hypothetical protein [Nanoarchaeales archaeon]